MEAEAKSQPHEPFEVRPATRDDVSAIATMQKKSLPETYEPFLGRAAVEEFVARGNVERYFEEHWRQSTVATLGGEVVGVAVLIDGLLDLIWGEAVSAVEGNRCRFDRGDLAPGRGRDRRVDARGLDSQRARC